MARRVWSCSATTNMQIAKVKSTATKDEIEKCPGCKVLDYVNSPASEAAQRQPQLTTSWVQRFGLPLYVDFGRRQRL